MTMIDVIMIALLMFAILFIELVFTIYYQMQNVRMTRMYYDLVTVHLHNMNCDSAEVLFKKVLDNYKSGKDLRKEFECCMGLVPISFLKTDYFHPFQIFRMLIADQAKCVLYDKGNLASLSEVSLNRRNRLIYSSEQANKFFKKMSSICME